MLSGYVLTLFSFRDILGQMKTIEYLFYLSSARKDRLRVWASREKNEIVEFAVQYEAEILDSWRPIVRYDTSHDFAHRDLMRANGTVDKQPLLFESYNLSLTYATQELKQNWQRYRHNFEEEENESK